MISVMENPQTAKALFEGLEETMIWSCLQKVMGEVYTNDLKAPESAAAILGDFCFFAGKPAAELAAYKPKGCKKDFMIMIPPNEEWAALIEACYGEKAKKVTRYAIKKEPDIFLKKKCQEKLEKIAKGLSREYVMKPLDREVFLWCKEQEWCGDWVSQYEDYGEYEKKGLGIVILKDGCLVAGASSYSSYREGIEIQIDTKQEYRRRGLALISGAALILRCLEKGLYPSWDAQNKESVMLAKKLGYHFDHEYTAYEIWGY